ncbi:coiled-coil domain-containing protein [Limosilactobacillus reuteri]|uniref:hypothetical protein n=1 Tax=Limosilactobacillus reuteri TaxID=1598 RepID=UPI00109452BE|nr:hypothetical protein [Limosilactobacillus reuteri]MBC8743085.1 hypothetical protein [Lactobacillus sp. Marseille-P7033]TGY55861.1 hypothetical protein E5337_10165 [Limosilactobacillus reuteri]
MPHGLLGLGWGEIVSLGTLIVVVLNYFKASISDTAHESNRKDMEDLKERLTDFKVNVSELSQLLKQVNKDLGSLTKRVDRHSNEIDNIKIELARIKEKIDMNDDDNGGNYK